MVTSEMELDWMGWDWNGAIQSYTGAGTGPAVEQAV